MAPLLERLESQDAAALRALLRRCVASAALRESALEAELDALEAPTEVAAPGPLLFPLPRLCADLRDDGPTPPPPLLFPYSPSNGTDNSSLQPTDASPLLPIEVPLPPTVPRLPLGRVSPPESKLRQPRIFVRRPKKAAKPPRLEHQYALTASQVKQLAQTLTPQQPRRQMSPPSTPPRRPPAAAPRTPMPTSARPATVETPTPATARPAARRGPSPRSPAPQPHDWDPPRGTTRTLPSRLPESPARALAARLPDHQTPTPWRAPAFASASPDTARPTRVLGVRSASLPPAVPMVLPSFVKAKLAAEWEKTMAPLAVDMFGWHRPQAWESNPGAGALKAQQW